MEDNNIKELFKNFEPEIPSDNQFMNKLKRSMTTVEIIRQHNHELRKRNKYAVLIAAICGFSMGIILTLILPLAGDWISTFDNIIRLPYIKVQSLSINYHFLAWIILAAVSSITALNDYEIAIARLTPKTSA